MTDIKTTLIANTKNSYNQKDTKANINRKQYGIAYDGTNDNPDYVLPSGNASLFIKNFKDSLIMHSASLSTVGEYMQKYSNIIFFEIFFALRKVEYLRGYYYYFANYGHTGYLVVRLRHINNTYPEYYIAANIPAREAEILLCFDKEIDKHKFIKKQKAYFCGKSFEDFIKFAEKESRKQMDEMLKEVNIKIKNGDDTSLKPSISGFY